MFVSRAAAKRRLKARTRSQLSTATNVGTSCLTYDALEEVCRKIAALTPNP